MSYNYLTKATRKGIKQPTTITVSTLASTPVVTALAGKVYVTSFGVKKSRDASELRNPETGEKVGGAFTMLKWAGSITLLPIGTSAVNVASVVTTLKAITTGASITIEGGDFGTSKAYKVLSNSFDPAESENCKFTLEIEKIDGYSQSSQVMASESPA